ncbi:hypothetical protein VKT23_010958 [Stygiomarasmius scandens]|uniref:Uncharacterized protein n=1 Tax=Marasmiellus scandens TaxID=2682957 RepID=A0ABR1JE55_9AGAR
MPKDPTTTRKTRRSASTPNPLSQSSRSKTSSTSGPGRAESKADLEDVTLSETKRSSKSRSSSKNATVTSKSDILIAMKPVFVDWIAARQKTHEFRKYLLTSSVERMWMYSSSPIQALQYIAIISHGKKPGEIVSTDTGVGNDEFNQGVHGCSGPSGYAYEIKELYELHEPLKLKDMQKRYGVTFPQRFVYVPEKMQEDFVIEKLKRIF